MTDEELALLREILDRLARVSATSRSRIVRSLETVLHDDSPAMTSNTSRGHRVPSEELKIVSRELNLPRFSEDRSASPKEFMLEKRPGTDVERIACLAYYLTHYRGQPEFKTQDLTALNQEAGQPRIGNATQATDNATKGHYLINGSRGHKQISALGEQFVQALPDRERARTVYREANVTRKGPRRRVARTKT